MLEIRRLRLLREVKIRGSLTQVALAYHQSPSAISQQLALLEREVGVALLVKSGRGVQLTPQAEILIRHAGAILDQLETAKSEMDASLLVAAGVVRMAVFQSAALALVPDALVDMAQRYPDLRIEVTHREPEAGLYETWARDFDLVVAEDYPGHTAPHHPDLDRVALTSDELRFAVPLSNPWSCDGLSSASSAPWVMEPRGTASRHWAEQRCRALGFEPDVRYESPDLHAHVRLVETGNAVALLPDLLWANRSSRAKLIPLDDRPRRRIFTAARLGTAPQPAIRAVRAALDEAVMRLQAPAAA